MTKEDIIRMAQAAGFGNYAHEARTMFERFFHMAQAAEREECAKVVDENAAGCLGLLKHVLKANANAIRRRSEIDSIVQNERSARGNDD